MHELGVVIEIVKSVKKVALENELTEITELVLQIGELSSMIPKYIESCFPMAAEGTILEKTKLIIEVLPGNGICLECNKVFNIVKEDGNCPSCRSKDFDVLCGKEFLIKEIVGQ